MEINPMATNLLPAENTLQPEIKPLKGYNLNSEVRQFEQILYHEQQYLLKTSPLVTETNTQNAISKLGKAFFEKVERYKQSIDSRRSNVDKLLGSSDDITIENLLRVQWEVSLFSVESLLISKSGEKVGEGIQTLFRNQ